MNKEATPTLRPVPGVNLDDYKKQLIERFSNAQVKDTVARLAAESSDRIPKWLVPVIREQLAADRDVTLCAAIVASWARYDEEIDENGKPIDVVDPLKNELVAIAKTQRQNPLAFIENKKLFGDLAGDERFTKPYLAALDSLHKVGAQKTLASLA
jgi:mannitol 2-dehydrogenase